MQVTIIYKAKQKMAGSCLPHPTIINSNSRLNVPDIRTFTERCVSVWRWSLCSLRVAEPSSPLEGFELGALQFFLLLCTRLLLGLLIIFNMKSVYDDERRKVSRCAVFTVIKLLLINNSMLQSPQLKVDVTIL